MCQGKPDLQAIERPRVSGEDPGGGLLEELGSAGIEQGEEGSHVCVGTTGTAALGAVWRFLGVVSMSIDNSNQQ